MDQTNSEEASKLEALTVLKERFDRATTTPEKLDVAWALYSHAPVGVLGRDFLKEHLGLRVSLSEDYLALALAGEAGSFLAAEIDANRITFPAVRRLLYEARGRKGRGRVSTVVRRRGEHVSLESAKVLYEAYLKQPVFKTAGGKVIRRKSATRAFNAEGARRPSPSDPDQKFWQLVREKMSEYLRRKCIGLDPLVIQNLFREAESDLKTLATSWQTRLKRLGMGIDVKQVAVTKACYQLGVSPPSRTKPVDLNTARTNMRRLAREYHPDVAGEGMRNQYEAVISAYEVLTQYNQQIGGVK